MMAMNQGQWSAVQTSSIKLEDPTLGHILAVCAHSQNELTGTGSGSQDRAIGAVRTGCVARSWLR